MTQNEKDLLLKDLCARLPYGVKCYKSAYKTDLPEKLVCVVKNSNHCCVQLGTYKYMLEHIKPYLLPLSSMTEEQRLELEIITDGTIGIDADSIWDFTGYSEISLSRTLEIIQWCYQNHFDINELIPMGLAINATNLNIY